ncbi:hypothetical protein HPP92_011302 [Vanilla planifolia]|uniref:Dienelactone hydrolase domain-containing protein n=1 Tax=Vanilla planifolia TaxID=51239 RepID=A0A835UYB5_VANPL|nr:hypothetical protein HPP92_011302 [Vanilla planifolia]
MAGAQCCENPPELSASSGEGSVVESLGGLKAYITGSTDSKAAILFVSDVFGFEAPNLRKLADKIAAAGFYVVVPDFLNGDPFDPEKVTISTWLVDHGTDKAFEDAKLIVAALKGKGFSAVGAAGACWGANKAHLAVLGAEIDQVTPPEVVKQFEEILSSKSEIDSFVKIFPGVAHGWTVRYDPNDEAAVKKAEEAHQDLLHWFVKHLK